MTNNQAIPMRIILKWLEECPYETYISSMSGSIIHIKVCIESKSDKEIDKKMSILNERKNIKVFITLW